MYLRCSTLIQKQVFENILFFVIDITFSVLMFQIFAHISLLKSENFRYSYRYKKLSYIMHFNNKTYLF